MDEAEIARLMSLLALTEANRRSQEEQQKLESIRNELAGLRQASTEDEHRQKSLHQCPACGGRLDGEFRKCKHCASDLVWIDHYVCEPGQEEALRQRLAAEGEAAQTARLMIRRIEQRRAELAAASAEPEQAAAGSAEPEQAAAGSAEPEQAAASADPDGINLFLGVIVVVFMAILMIVIIASCSGE